MSAISELSFWMDYNGYKNTDFDVQVVKRPAIPVPVQKVKYIDIAGRDGTLTETDGTYEDIKFNVELNYLSRSGKSFTEVARAMKNWLTGSGKLKFSDDPDVFYRVKHASIDSQIEREFWRAGFFSALFVCEPFTYFESGAEFNLVENGVLLNPYRKTLPIYLIEGEGVCKLTVNNSEANLNVGQNLYIDTFLEIMYRMDGTIQNAASRIRYKDFLLKEGTNTISVSDGFSLHIQPNWRSL